MMIRSKTLNNDWLFFDPFSWKFVAVILGDMVKMFCVEERKLPSSMTKISQFLAHFIQFATNLWRFAHHIFKIANKTIKMVPFETVFSGRFVPLKKVETKGKKRKVMIT